MQLWLALGLLCTEREWLWMDGHYSIVIQHLKTMDKGNSVAILLRQKMQVVMMEFSH